LITSKSLGVVVVSPLAMTNSSFPHIGERRGFAASETSPPTAPGSAF
jgi:hypothetical protein